MRDDLTTTHFTDQVARIKQDEAVKLARINRAATILWIIGIAVFGLPVSFIWGIFTKIIGIFFKPS